MASVKSCQVSVIRTVLPTYLKNAMEIVLSKLKSKYSVAKKIIIKNQIKSTDNVRIINYLPLIVKKNTHPTGG